MKYLENRPQTALVGPLARDKYLYESRIAGVGSGGPNRDLFQQRPQLSGISGTSFEPFQRRNHHRTQHCTIDTEGVIRVEPGKTGIEGRPLVFNPKDEWATSAIDERVGWAKGRPTSAPATNKPNWIARDKQILTFHCYYKETVEGSQEETDRIRMCKLYFYLEDDSVTVVETSQENSGMIQGRVVRRLQVPFKPVSDDPDQGRRFMESKCLTMWDLNIGADVNIFGKIFKLVDCDNFTRNFLRSQGVRVPSEIPVPTRDYDEKRALSCKKEAKRPYKKLNNLNQFLENDGKVLRFFGYWNDGLDKRQLILLFFLSDDTIQVNEKHPDSGGRYRAPIFLKRTKLPKDSNLLVSLPGTLNEETVLNVVSIPGTGRRKKSHLITDNRDMSSRIVQYYDASDLSVGTTIIICGKELFLFDCDDFTREYYKIKFDVDQMKRIEVDNEVKKRPEKQVPPYTGLGSEEDSLTSWLGGNSLEPRPPQRDFFKFQKLDRYGYDSHVLRFAARLINDDNIDKYRKFVIAFYLADDQMQVSVLPDNGSGIKPGKFLEKARMKKPKKFQSDDPALHSNYYTAQDIYVGAILEINSHTFLITTADDYVFDFMEREEFREQFAHSNIRLVLNKVAARVGENFKAMMARFMRDDPADIGVCSESVFRTVIDEFIGFDLSEHEIITLIRKYRTVSKTKSTDGEKSRIQSLLQANLRSDNFSNFDKLLLSLKQADRSQSGCLSKAEIRRVLLSSLGLTRSQHRTQSFRHLLDGFLSAQDADDMDYVELVHQLNWISNPCVPIGPAVVKVEAECWERASPARSSRDFIDYRMLMEELKEKI